MIMAFPAIHSIRAKPRTCARGNRQVEGLGKCKDMFRLQEEHWQNDKRTHPSAAFRSCLEYNAFGT